jgi:hypothetical protein
MSAVLDGNYSREVDDMNRKIMTMGALLGVCALALAGCLGGQSQPEVVPTEMVIAIEECPVLPVQVSADSETVNCWDYQPDSAKPKEGWEGVDLSGMTRDELLDVLGCPLHSMRLGAVGNPAYIRELWVYHPYDEDPTGLYIWLQGGVFHASRLDEFTGFWGFEFDNPEFWQ